LHPEADAQGDGYHISQALIAIGSGGIVGQGLGRSVQAFGYLPEAANDSIFAVVAEKFGFVGSVLLIALFGMLLFRIVSIIERTPDMFARLVATGILAWITAHILINIGAMLSLLPLKGITLPFISYGGSSLLFTMAAIGLLLQISRFTVPKARMSSYKGGTHEGTRLGGRDRRPRYANVSRSS
jgi:cell division protein FtsW